MAYLGIGMWYNYSHYGASGWDLVPHRHFWRELPYMVNDVLRRFTRPSPATGAYEPV